MSRRGKVKAFGAPFDIKYSSCSNLKPTLFDWDAYESDIHVYIDYAIINQGHLSPKTISKLKNCLTAACTISMKFTFSENMFYSFNKFPHY